MNTQLQTTPSQAVTSAPSLPTDISWPDLQCALAGDLGRLTAEGRVKYYNALCQFVGLNPLGFPFAWVQFQGKTVLYPKKECADQLRKIHNVSVEIISEKFELGVYRVRVKATTPDGRIDTDEGVVQFNEREAANIIKKAITQAKRRVTLAMFGLANNDVEETEDATTGNGRVSQLAETSSASLAQKLNDSIASSEKAQAITIAPSPEPVAEQVPVKSEPIKPAATVVEAEVVTQPVSQPQAAPAPVSNGLPDSVVVQLETILSEGDIKKSIAYLIAKNKLKPMEGLDALKKDVSDFIIKDPKRFHKMVADWQPK